MAPRKKGGVTVVCVDRDNDLGRKAGVRGPVIGRAMVIKAAEKLALADPSDSDVNALFETIKAYDELKKKGENVRVAVLTGSHPAGIESDEIIEKQADRLFKRAPAKRVVLVTDGASDAYVVPILKARASAVYTRKVVVKQSPQLEGAYIMAYDFIKSVMSDPSVSRVFLGIPAVALLIIALFGTEQGWRLVLGFTGLFLLVKGFQLESVLGDLSAELKTSFKTKQTSFFIYIVALAFAAIGVMTGYGAVQEAAAADLLSSLAIFVQASVFVIFLSAALFGIGMALARPRPHYMKYLMYFVIAFSVSWILFALSEFVLSPARGIIEVAYSAIIGGALVFVTLALQKKRH